MRGNPDGFLCAQWRGKEDLIDRIAARNAPLLTFRNPVGLD